MKSSYKEKSKRPAQKQSRQPGRTKLMKPRPDDSMEEYAPAGKLKGKVAIVTGGDSGIGRAVCVAFAKEGADVAFIYLEEDEDARETRRLIEREGRMAVSMRGDVGDEAFCGRAIEEVVKEFGHLDILVNNAAEQHVRDSLGDITEAQLAKTFRTNVFSMFFLTKAALKYLKEGGAIINTASITAYEGHPKLIDYASTKGAIVAFTRSLSQSLVERGIRVNGVAPGPIWTPLIPASFDAKKVEMFGKNVPMGRAGQPDEVAPSFVFLASDDSSYMSGQVLHPNGGVVING